MAAGTAATTNRFTLNGTSFERAGESVGLDPLLIYAIALLESGYGHGKGFVGPWHWTLRGPSTALYLDARGQAESELSALLRTTTRVDVGAMQVNVHWNGHRVTEPSQLLDPELNILVGAAILRDSINSSSDLVLGVGRYHNWSNPERARNYGQRALAVHSNLRGLAGRLP